ncbi:MAG: DUF2225 domain-containing protein [Alkaliphilus sp.]
MNIDTYLYDKDVKCPVCYIRFKINKVRSRRLKTIKKHDDLYVTYKGINPIHYSIWVCPGCGYSTTEKEFYEIKKAQIPIIEESIKKSWNKKDYNRERTAKEAESTYKLAILTGQLLSKPKGYMGEICLKLAWVYRDIGSAKESEYLQNALDFFEYAYQHERLPVATLDELTMTYLIGELHRQLGNYAKAIHWYNKTLEHNQIKTKRWMQLKTREQWSKAKEQYDIEKKVE